MIHKIKNSKGDECQTPKKYLDLVRKVLCYIELDPSSTKVQRNGIIMEKCNSFCIPNHRIKFYENGSNWYSQTFFYFGDHPKYFKNIFTEIGVCR